MPFSLFRKKSFFLFLFFASTTLLRGQSEALLDIDVNEGVIRVQLTKEVKTFSQIEFELIGVSEITTHRRQLRKRENVTLSKSGDKWKFDTGQWKNQPHQALDLQYEIRLQALGGLARRNGDLVLNPVKCKTCSSLNPFEVRQFTWAKVLPSSVSRLNLSIRIPQNFTWSSSNEAVFIVEDDALRTINFGEVNLRDFYFVTESDVLLAVGDQKIEEQEFVTQEQKKESLDERDLISTTEKPQNKEDDKDIIDSTEKEEQAKRPLRRLVEVNLRPLPMMTRPLDKRLNPLLSLPFDVEPVKLPTISESTPMELVFQQRFEPAYLGLFHVVDKELFSRIEMLKDAGDEGKLWELALQQFRMEYGDDEALVRTLYNYERGGYQQPEPGKIVFTNEFSAAPTTIHVRRNRTKDCLEISHTGNTKTEIILSYPNGDTTVTVDKNETRCLSKPTPEFYFPAKINGPIAFTLSDGQAWQLYREREDALSRYWAFRSLINSASPHTRATAASFGLDDPLQTIREMALKAAETIPAFAASRLENGLLQLMQEGSYFEASKAAKVLREKLGKENIELPVYPCDTTTNWNQSAENVICQWILRFPTEKVTVIEEINAKIKVLKSENESEDIEALQTLALIFAGLM